MLDLDNKLYMLTRRSRDSIELTEKATIIVACKRPAEQVPPCMPRCGAVG